MRPTTLLPPLLLLATLATGCAKYDYDILQPESSHARIGDDWQRVAAGPVTYRFRAVETHLVVQIYNTTDRPVRILGDRSYVVTPADQSIPLASQSIAPGSYAKLILPPLQQMIHPGPSIGFGVGYTTGRADPPHSYDPAFHQPTYLDVENPPTYWEWDDESRVTLHVAIEDAGRIVEQTFVLQRVKV